MHIYSYKKTYDDILNEMNANTIYKMVINFLKKNCLHFHYFSNFLSDWSISLEGVTIVLVLFVIEKYTEFSISSYNWHTPTNTSTATQNSWVERQFNENFPVLHWWIMYFKSLSL